MSEVCSASDHGKYIIVTGGVLSSLGKGIAAASIGALMESRGLSVSLMKFDPYLNIDPGFMSPYQHGEVFITDDGAECDLDVGHYERYTKAKLTRQHNIAAGRIYFAIIEKERAGAYGDGTVQVIPHLTDEIKSLMRQGAEGKDVTIIEIGGTVGDIESLPFIEAARQLRLESGPKNVLFIHLTLVPFIKVSDEVKTKPTQHSVATLRGIGIQPDILICRTEKPFDDSVKRKLSLFCNVSQENVICSPDVEHVYEVPMTMHSEGLDERIVEALNMWTRRPDLSLWDTMVKRLKNPKSEIKLGILDEGVSFKEAYKSLSEALIHAGLHHDVKIKTVYIDALKGLAGLAGLPELCGLIVPNGDVKDGHSGKLDIIKHFRLEGLPVIGFGTGAQLMVIEALRHLGDLAGADSTEFNSNCAEPVFHLLPHWLNPRTNREEKRLEGPDWAKPMRKGAYPALLVKESELYKIYNQEEISERHRHRGEFNQKYLDHLEKAHFKIAAKSADGIFCEAFEMTEHPFYIGTLYQPEFLSRPMAPHPLLVAFIKASLDKFNNENQNS